jgi:glycerol-3-phosphate dehydrogenase
MSVARTAVRHGAVVATRVTAESLIREGKRVVGVNARDLETGKRIAIKAGATVMCAGIWSDELHENFELTPGYGVTMSKGVHIVLPGSAIKSDAGIILKTPVSVLFLIPWGDKWIVGTTDTPYDGDRAEPFASREDVQYILDQANRVLEPKLNVEEIIGVYAGLRPLVANKKSATTTKLSREHTVDRPAAGFVSIAGGKYTTYRVMGKDAIDRAVIELRRLTQESVTEKLPLVGADGYFALEQQKDRIAQDSGLDVETVIHLLNRYGSLISEILELISEQPKLAKKLDESLPYIKAEIVYAASHEGARTVDDVISRRTRLAFEAREHGVYLADEVALLIAPVLGWSAKDKKQSIAEYQQLVDRELEALNQLLEVNS